MQAVHVCVCIPCECITCLLFQSHSIRLDVCYLCMNSCTCYRLVNTSLKVTVLLYSSIILLHPPLPDYFHYCWIDARKCLHAPAHSLKGVNEKEVCNILLYEDTVVGRKDYILCVNLLRFSVHLPQLSDNYYDQETTPPSPVGGGWGWYLAI